MQKSSAFTRVTGQILGALLCAAWLFGSPAMAEEKSLYERIGGYKAVAASVDDLVDRIYVNATLNKNPVLKAVHDQNERAAFKLILATWVMQETGGPKVYFGRPMDQAHKALNITNREFDVIMHECKETFYKLGVPEKETGELMAGLQSYRDKIVTADKPVPAAEARN